MKMDLAFFPSVEGSMTSEDGTLFMLHVKRETGGDLLLGFPHGEISNIVENAAKVPRSGSCCRRTCRVSRARRFKSWRTNASSRTHLTLTSPKT
jgi:hypothetical protein